MPSAPEAEPAAVAGAVGKPPTTSPVTRRPLLVPALIALLCVIWGSTWWAIRICLVEQPPLWSAALRFAIAGLAMGALAPALRRVDRKPPPPAWLWLVAGTCSFAGSYGILYVAERVVPSGIAAVLWAIFPLLMAGSGVCFLGERLGARQLAGFCVSFLGVVAVLAGDLGAAPTVPSATGELGASGAPGALLGSALFLLLSPIVSAVGTTLVKKYGQGTSSVLMNRNGMLFGAVLLTIAAAVGEGEAPMRWTGPVVAATLYLALFGTTLTFGTYFWLLQRVPASSLALVSYVTPVVAMLLAVVVGDGTTDVWSWIGTAGVVGGVVLVVQKPRAAR